MNHPDKDLFEMYEDAGIFFLRSISRYLNWQLTAQDIWELAAIANGGGFTAFVNTVERARTHGSFPWNDAAEVRSDHRSLPPMEETDWTTTPAETASAEAAPRNTGKLEEN